MLSDYCMFRAPRYSKTAENHGVCVCVCVCVSCECVCVCMCVCVCERASAHACVQ